MASLFSSRFSTGRRGRTARPFLETAPSQFPEPTGARKLDSVLNSWSPCQAADIQDLGCRRKVGLGAETQIAGNRLPVGAVQPPDGAQHIKLPAPPGQAGAGLISHRLMQRRYAPRCEAELSWIHLDQVHVNVTKTLH